MASGETNDLANYHYHHRSGHGRHYRRMDMDVVERDAVMDHNTIEKCAAILAIALIAVVGILMIKSDTLASMAIGAIAGLAGSGVMGGSAAIANLFGPKRTKGDTDEKNAG